MKPILQLLRRPWKTLLGILFSMLACAVACVCHGQYIASVQTEAAVEENYTSVGILTSKFMEDIIEDEEGNIISTIYTDSQPLQVQNFLSEVSGSSFVKSVQQISLISAHLPEVTAFNVDARDEKREIATEDPKWGLYATYGADANPFHYAMFAVKVEEVSEPRLYINYDSIVTNPEDYGYALDVTGTIVETVSLQEGWPDPVGHRLNLTIRFAAQEEAATARIRPQETWLFCGTNYQDSDLYLRQNIAWGFCRPSEIDWSNIEFFSEAKIASLPFPCVGIYHYDGAEGGAYIVEEDLQLINSSSLTVCLEPRLYERDANGTSFHLSSGKTITGEEYCARYLDSGMVRLEGSAREFLEQTDDPFWSKWLQTAQINDHSFPVLGVESLNAVAQFAIEDASISDGRAFTQEELDSGAHVCVISQTLAAANGLQVGDKISLQYFEKDTVLQSNMDVLPQANPSASYYSPAMGFSSEAAQYQIVGLYRQKNEWEDSPYGFTPNTIFVPATAFSGGENICGGLFTSVILQNGTIDQLEQLAADAGLEGLFACFDQGYSQIMSSLAGYYEVGIVVLRAGLALWLVLTVLYLFLFPLQLRPDMRRMWELGAPEAKIRRFALAHNFGILLPGSALGCLIAALLFGKVTARIAAAAEVELSLTLSPLTLCLIAAAQLLLATAAVYLVTYFVTRKMKNHRGKT